MPEKAYYAKPMAFIKPCMPGSGGFMPKSYKDSRIMQSYEKNTTVKLCYCKKKTEKNWLFCQNTGNNIFFIL